MKSNLILLTTSFIISECIFKRKSICENSNNNRKIVLVKYGGSAITVKSTYETFNVPKIKETALQVKQIVKSNENLMLPNKLIIIHGAGSFGHFHAKLYNLKTGGDDETWQEGLSLTRQSVLKLNKKVVDCHISEGLNVVSVSPFPPTVTSNVANNKENKIEIVNNGALDSISSIVDNGIIPVIHGDVVLDKNRNCSILSGDQIILW
jgi:isopentenyl phosphate kinase